MRRNFTSYWSTVQAGSFSICWPSRTSSRRNSKFPFITEPSSTLLKSSWPYNNFIIIKSSTESIFLYHLVWNPKILSLIVKEISNLLTSDSPKYSTAKTVSPCPSVEHQNIWLQKSLRKWVMVLMSIGGVSAVSFIKWSPDSLHIIVTTEWSCSSPLSIKTLMSARYFLN